MRKANLILLIISCFYLGACTQKKDTWVAFYNKDTTLVGFKDKQGQIKIPPRFTTYGVARKFDDIIAVSEFRKPKDANYYLTKKGRIVGRDSLYYFDSFPDCECEGFIRFRDPKSLKMGIFNSDGNIAIPATYNYVSSVRNGLIMALTGARRVYPKDPNEEHFDPWEGGTDVLMDVNNKILIRNFPYNDDIDFYSLIVSDEPDKNPIRKNFKGTNGKNYSFISFEKEFDKWFTENMLSEISIPHLAGVSNDSILLWTNKGWRNGSKETYITKNFGRLKATLSRLRTVKDKYYVSKEGLNPYCYDIDLYAEYFDNCGMPKDWINPVMNVVITPGDRDGFEQDSFEFLRTTAGYKLISFSIH